MYFYQCFSPGCQGEPLLPFIDKKNVNEWKLKYGRYHECILMCSCVRQELSSAQWFNSSQLWSNMNLASTVEKCSNWSNRSTNITVHHLSDDHRLQHLVHIFLWGGVYLFVNVVPEWCMLPTASHMSFIFIQI